jgi:hypothetical protein
MLKQSTRCQISFPMTFNPEKIILFSHIPKSNLKQKAVKSPKSYSIVNSIVNCVTNIDVEMHIFFKWEGVKLL